jgi:hypothetical protein
MRKLCRCTVVLGALFTLGLLVATTPRPAQARPTYLGWWLETYPDVAKKNDVKTAVKCNVCHFGTSKKNRNDYGKAITKALAPKKNLKKTDENKDLFNEALKTAAKQKSATEGKSFGDLLDAGELPSPPK